MILAITLLVVFVLGIFVGIVLGQQSTLWSIRQERGIRLDYNPGNPIGEGRYVLTHRMDTP